LSSKLDTSAFDEWTATHSAGQEYSAGEGIDITDHVISYTGDPGDATPWISGNKIITSADYMQPGEFIQVVSSFDLSGNKNHFITMKGQGYYFPTNQQLKERVDISSYLPTSSFSSYTASIASNLENNWNYTNSAYSQSLNNYYNKLDISAFSSWSSEHSGDYLTKESADTLYQPIGDYLTTADSALFYPMEGNPSGFLTGVDLTDYYKKNETSSKEEIANALTAIDNTISGLTGEFQEKGDYYSASNPSGFITGVDLSNYYQKNETSSKQEIGDVITEINNNITNLSGKYYPLNSNPSGYLTAHQDISDKLDVTAFTAYTATAQGTEYTAGDNIDITNHVISGKDWSSEIENATTGKLDASAFNSGDFYPMTGNPSGFITGVDLTPYQEKSGMTAYQSAGDYYSASNPSGFITGVDLSNYYEKNETSSKEELSAALSGLTAETIDLSAGEGISIIETANKVVISCTATGAGFDPTYMSAQIDNKLDKSESANYYTKTEIQNQSGNYYPMTGNPSGFLTNNDAPNIFIAVYNSTPFSALQEAYAAGKMILCKDTESSPRTYTTDTVSVNEGALSYIKFAGVLNVSNKTIIDDYTIVQQYSCYSNGWNSSRITAYSALQSDWSQTATKNITYIKNKPDLTQYQSIADMTAYYQKNETSSKQQISAALADAGHEYTGIAPIGVNNTTYQISAETWSLSAGDGLRLTEDAISKVATLSITGGAGGGSTIKWYTDTPAEHTSADIDLVIQTTATLGGSYDRNLLDGNGNFIGALIPSAGNGDLGKVLTITAGSPRWQDLPETPSGAYGIKTEVVANSGLATGQNILYIVTGV